jgi:hypothetical protein
MITRILAIALLTATTALTPAAAAQFTRSGDYLFMTGAITAGDMERFRAVVDGVAGASAKAPPGHDGAKTVVLTSTGGSVYEAMDVGRVIRERGLGTEVRAGYECLSSCSLIWASGVKRVAAGRIAMHCPIRNQFQCQPDTRADMVAYLKEMGAPNVMIQYQEAAGSTSALYIEPEKLAEVPEVVPTPKGRPTVVADGRDYVEPPDEDYPPPPPRRHPPPRYYGPPVYGPPPGWIFIPSEQRAMPCLPTLLTFGVLRFCI